MRLGRPWAMPVAPGPMVAAVHGQEVAPKPGPEVLKPAFMAVTQARFQPEPEISRRLGRDQSPSRPALSYCQLLFNLLDERNDWRQDGRNDWNDWMQDAFNYRHDRFHGIVLRKLVEENDIQKRLIDLDSAIVVYKS